MFTRFSDEARGLVARAQKGASAMGAEKIGTEHFLLGLLESEDDPAVDAFSTIGIDRATIAKRLADPLGDIDADALASIGISLDAVRDAVQDSLDEEMFKASSADKLPFTTEAKTALECSLRELLRSDEGSSLADLAAIKKKQITPTHIALGFLRKGTHATALLEAIGADVPAIRARLSQGTDE